MCTLTQQLLEMAGISTLELAGMLVAVSAAAVIQAVLGMGYGLAAAPMLALLNPVFVPAPTIVIGLLTSLLGAYSERQEIMWSEVGYASGGRLIGTLLAIVALSLTLDQRFFLILFATLIIAAVLFSIGGWKLPLTGSNLLLMGSLSGTMGTITGVGAPPFAVIYSHHSAVHARPTLAAVFALGCAISLAGLTVIGWVGGQQVVLSVLMVPPMLIGTLCGRRLRNSVNMHYRSALLTVAGVSAFLLLFKGIHQFM